MQKTHLKKHARKAISVIMTTLTILSLTACGNNGTTANGNSSGSNSKNEASEQVTKTDYTISEFFSEAPYKVLYVADTPITKDSKLKEIWIIDNGKIEIYDGPYIWNFQDTGSPTYKSLPKEVDSLTIGDISKMTDEEVINYYKKIPDIISTYNQVTLCSFTTGWKYSDLPYHSTYDYKIHAFTDGSGNNIKSEYLVINDGLKDDTETYTYYPDGNYSYPEPEKITLKCKRSYDFLYTLIPHKNNFSIYDQNYTGLMNLISDGSTLLFTRTANESAINITLDNINNNSIVIDPSKENCAGSYTDYLDDPSILEKYGYKKHTSKIYSDESAYKKASRFH